MTRAFTVAKHDFENARRSNLLWGVIGLFLLLVVAVIAVPRLLSGDTPGREAVALLIDPIGILIPVTAIVATALAVAGERDSGRLNILLSLPPTRLEVVLGKFISRAAIVLVALAIAFVVALVATPLLYDDFPARSFLLTMVLSMLLALTFVAIMTGLSSLIATRSRAMMAGFGVFVLFSGLWGGLVSGVNLVADEVLNTSIDPQVLTFIRILSPKEAFNRLYTALVAPDLYNANPGDVVFSFTGGFTQIPDPSAAPVYLQNWALLLVIVGWVVVPLTVGYLGFERADLN